MRAGHPETYRRIMTTTVIDTVVVGAGQAGLATGYHLQHRDLPFTILEAGPRVGDQWRRQWDSLTLYSPAQYDSLPGLPFPAPDWSFPDKNRVADYLELYARRFDLPVRTDTRAARLESRPDGGFHLATNNGDYDCRNVVIATGTFGRTPAIPELAKDLDPGILQLHSSEYRRPGQLQQGSVLVVGASHSGCDIAYEVAPTHATVLIGPDHGEIPPRLDAPAMRVLFPALWFVWSRLATRSTPLGRKLMPKVRHHGGPGLRVKRADLRERGVERSISHLEEIRAGLPVVDGTPRDVATVVWATGFRQVFDWVDLPIFGADGYPEELRGITGIPGCYFVGLSFQYSFSSMLIGGVGRDAAHVVGHLATHRQQIAPAFGL